MLDKLSNSWALAKASAQVLKSDKELLIFPLLSGIVLIVLTLSLALPTVIFGETLATTAEGGLPVLGYALIFLFYVVQYTVMFFFNTALVGAAMIRLDGGDPTVSDGLRIAFSKLGSIVGYALIAASVGMVLRALAERSGLIGRIVIGLVGMAWNLATYLVVPVLVVKDVGPIEAIKESATTLKKTWGEQVAGNVGIGLVFGLMSLGVILLTVPLVALVLRTGQPILLGTVIAVAVIALLLLGLVNATLSGIYSAAVYRFATQGDAGGAFDRAQLQQAFVPKA